MSIPNFIAKLTNPFDDLNIISKLVQAYTDGNYYAQVIRVMDSSKVVRKNRVNDVNEFYVTTYNKWRDNVVNMTKEEFEALKAKGRLKNDFIRVREFIRKCPLPQTKEDVMNILYAKKDNDLMDALDHYNPFEQVESSWIYLASRFYDNRKTPPFLMTHRLYLNIDSDAVYKVALELFNKCNELNIRYEYKFCGHANRADSMVIYCSDDNLLLFVKLLELIRKENPELEGKFHTPPIFSGVYDGWIGYGEEYSKAKSSYTMDRCDIIEERLNGHFNNWRCKAGNLRVTLDGKNVDIVDYIVHEIIRDFYDSERSQYEYRINNNSPKYAGDINLLYDKRYHDEVYSIIKKFLIENKGNIFSHEELSNAYCEIPDITGNKTKIRISNVKYILISIFVNSIKNNKKVLKFFSDDFKMEFKRRDLSDRVVMSNETLNNMLKYQSDKLNGHRVIASRKANNRKLYKQILVLLDEMAEIIKKHGNTGKVDYLLKPYIHKYKLYKNALDRVGIYSFSGSSIDEDERAQYYIAQMYQSIDMVNIEAYNYYRNLTLAYDEILESGKKL